MSPIEVPPALAASHVFYSGEAGRRWVDGLPGLADELMQRWQLRPDGRALSGAVALVLPVVDADGAAAVLKIQPIDDETVGEPVALRAWAGHACVRLLRHDPASGSMLLERLDATRTLASVPDDLAALRSLSELLGVLSAVPAPPGLRQLGDIAAAMVAEVPAVADRLPQPSAALMRSCAAALAEVLPEPGDRLLHWDLHYANVLGGNGRAEWLAIDPKPLAGDPGFELLAALHNRWPDVAATGDVPRAVRRRFDLMTDVAGLDRERSRRWTLGRALQNMLWDAARGRPCEVTAYDRAIAKALLS